MHQPPLPFDDAYTSALSAFTNKQTDLVTQVHAIMDFIASAQGEDFTPAQAAALAAAMRRAGYKGLHDPDYNNPHPAPMGIGECTGDFKKNLLTHVFTAVQNGHASALAFLTHDVGFTFGQIIENLDRLADGKTDYMARVPGYALREALEVYEFAAQPVMNIPQGAVAAPMYRN